METIEEMTEVAVDAKKQGVEIHRHKKTEALSRFSFSAQAAAFENARYFWMSVFLTAQSCLGAVACMFILYSGGNIVELSICAAVTMGSNAMFIGLASPKVCLAVLYSSIALNLFFIVSNPI